MIDNQNAGVFLGRTLLQARGKIGGHRFVFVKLQGVKNELVFPTNGIAILNPPKSPSKFYAGDLVEYRMDGTGYILRTFKVISATGMNVSIERSGYRHKPFIGDVLMKAQDKVDTVGAFATVTAVKEDVEDGKDVWVLTMSGDTTAAAGDILVEAAKDGTMLVKNPNTFAPCDYDMLYDPATSDDDFDGARYFMTPALHGIAYVSRMSPLPEVFKARNKSLVEGWYEL